MTPEQLKRDLDGHIRMLEGAIKQTDAFAHKLGRRYGVYGLDDPKDIYQTRTLLRQLQEQLETDPGKAEFLSNVHTLGEQGRL
jgi:hypothetical protein